MTPTNTIPTQTTVLPIKLKAIAESPFNQRKTFNEASLKEMAASILQEGVIQPVILRNHPKPKGALLYELVVGARRFRGTEIAGVDYIPAIVREYTDEQVQAIQMIENDQREKVNELEQARGYKILLETPGYTLDIIAEKIGKDAPFVHKRISLLALIPEIQTLLRDGHITISHALELSRIPAEGQKRMLERYLIDMSSGHYVSGLGHVQTGPQVVSLPVLKAAIQREVFMNLSVAPWNKEEAITLQPEGKGKAKTIKPCSTCTERSGANAKLFTDLSVEENDVCMNRTCYSEKSNAHLVHIMKAKEGAGEKIARLSASYNPDPALKAIPRDKYHEITAKKDRCASAVEGIFVDGASRAQTVQVCVNASCDKHGSKVSSSSGESGNLSLWERRENKLPQTIEWDSRKAIVEAILGKTPKWSVPHEQLQVIATALLPGSISSVILDMLAIPGIPIGEKLSGTETVDKLKEIIASKKGSTLAEELPRVIIALALKERIREFDYGVGAKNDLAAAAAAFGVDDKKVAADTAKSIRDEFKAKRAAAEAKRAGKSASPAPPANKAKSKPATKKKAPAKKGVKK